jgi:hypothetical protein
VSNVCACVCVAYVFISYVCTHTRFLFCIIYMCVYICIYKPGVGGEQDFFFVHTPIYICIYIPGAGGEQGFGGCFPELSGRI